MSLGKDDQGNFLFQLRKSGTPAGANQTFHYSLEPHPAAAKKALSVCGRAGPAMASTFQQGLRGGETDSSRLGTTAKPAWERAVLTSAASPGGFLSFVLVSCIPGPAWATGPWTYWSHLWAADDWGQSIWAGKDALGQSVVIGRERKMEGVDVQFLYKELYVLPVFQLLDCCGDATDSCPPTLGSQGFI